MIKSTLALAAILIALVPARAAEPGTMTVTVAGIRNDHGKIYVALYDSAEAYKAQRRRDGKIVPAKTGEITVVFENLPPGLYGVSAFHDENNNGKLDTTLLGIPTEGFGFSRDAIGHFGPPAFADFAVPPGTIRVTLRYR
jgi:uncharacterized protein (DUF2141 family)